MFKKITIVGLGLMGGSLAAACRKKFPKATICGVTRSREALREALRRKWICQATSDLRTGIQDADLVVLCTPVNTFPHYLKEIDRFGPKGMLVTDVGSAKSWVEKKIKGKPWKKLSFVSCHPMVGSHHRGIRAVDPKLYHNGLMILIKTPATGGAAFQKVRKFWGSFSRNLITLTPSAHDRLIGEASHLPHAMAVCLVQSVSPQAMKFASTGFRDTTRIAASASSIWAPIFKANQRDVLTAIRRFEKELHQFKKQLKASDATAFCRYLDQAHRRRESL